MIIRTNRNLADVASAADALTVIVPPQSSYHLPAGTFRAVISNLRPINRESQYGGISMLRIYFDVQVPQLSQFRCMAKLDVRRELSEGGDLRNLIDRLLGKSVLQQASGQRFDLQTMIGSECDIVLEHVHNDNCEHQHPFVIVTDVQPAGQLLVEL